MNEIKDAWNAVAARDARADGKFVFAVRTTGIYCRPSCPARRPLRENAAFFRTPSAAEAAGFRECRRCRPRSDGGPAADARLVREACRLIVKRAETEEALLIADVARELSVSPSKLSRLFARHAGTTPKKFAVGRRFDAFKRGARSAGVVEAQNAAGFGSSSRLYEAARGYLGMTPGAYAKGGEGEILSYGFAPSPVGLLLVASTSRGLCHAELGDSRKDLERRLRARFPNAAFRPDAKMAAAAGRALSSARGGLKIDARGSAFQRLVWDALKKIPAGRTKTYSEVARDIGRPRAVRAVARACATNSIAIAIPCHRVVGAGGKLSGYRWGVERKRRLLALEGAAVPRKTADLLLFALLAAFWGGSFVAIKFAVEAFPTSFSAMLRVGLALIVLAAYFGWEGRELRVPLATGLRMWLAGLFSIGLPFALLFWGERRISPGLAGIINGTVPLWAFVLGLLAATGESFTARKAAGLALGFLGIGAICAPLLTFGGTPGELAGTAAVFLMAVFYGVGALLTRSLLSGAAKVDFRANLVHQLLASAVFLALVSFAADKWPSPSAFFSSTAALISIVYLGVFSTALAFLIYFHLIREWGAVRASAVTYVVPIVAVFWDYVFFGNVPDRFEAVGVLAVLSGVMLLHAPARPSVAVKVVRPGERQ